MKETVLRLEQAANNLALNLLDILDVRVSVVLCLGLLLTLGAISVAVRRRMPTMDEALKAGLAILSGLASVPIACVFLLTTPPAIDKMSEDTRGVVGLICVVVLSYMSVTEIRSVLFGRAGKTT